MPFKEFNFLFGVCIVAQLCDALRGVFLHHKETDCLSLDRFGASFYISIGSSSTAFPLISITGFVISEAFCTSINLALPLVSVPIKFLHQCNFCSFFPFVLKLYILNESQAIKLLLI